MNGLNTNPAINIPIELNSNQLLNPPIDTNYVGTDQVISLKKLIDGIVQKTQEIDTNQFNKTIDTIILNKDINESIGQSFHNIITSNKLGFWLIY